MEDKKGIKVGAAATGMGATAIGGAKFLEDNLKGKGLLKIKKISTQDFRRGVMKGAEKVGMSPKTAVKTCKRLGAGVGAVGLGVAGVSAYKHYKNKKKKDDSTEG